MATWTTEAEIALFEALIKYKPVGLHKHLRVLNIQRTMREATGLRFSVTALWEKLRQLYNLDALDRLAEEDESDNDDDNDEPVEFALPPQILDENLSKARSARQAAAAAATLDADDTEGAATTKKGRGRGSRASAPATPAPAPQTPVSKDKHSPKTPASNDLPAGRRGNKRPIDSPSSSSTSTPPTKKGKR